MLATGNVSAALEILQKNGRFWENSNQNERIPAVARSYIEPLEKRSLFPPMTLHGVS
jgi:hypothetical protein